MLHVPDIDMNTTCWTFLECLQSIRTFTRAVPDHEPIAIYLELKEDDLDEVIGPAGAQLAPVILKSLGTPGPDTYVVTCLILFSSSRSPKAPMRSLYT